MDRWTLERLIEKKKEITVTYRREKDELLKVYSLLAVEVKSETLKDGSVETYLYAVKLPQNFTGKKIQKFILRRITSAN